MKTKSKLTKGQLFKRIEPFLKDFTLFDVKPDQILHTYGDLVMLLDKKGYKVIKRTKDLTFWIKPYSPGNIARNKNKSSYLAEANKDYSLVILTKTVGSEGLVSTKSQTGWSFGLYDGGGISSFTELFEYIVKNR